MCSARATQPSVTCFRVASTTVPDLSLENGGWEDDESHPSMACRIAEAFHLTWGLVAGCLERWTADDITVQIPQREHEAYHGGVISLILGTNGLPSLDI